MNRKNTILIAVMINVGLLAVLLITALTTQEESISSTAFVEDTVPELPKFDDSLKFNETPLTATPAPLKIAEIPLTVPEETLVHKLPPLISELAPAQTPITPPVLDEVVVKKGDHLEKIAKSHKTTVDAIININHLSNHFLKIGQVLKIPAPSQALEKKKPLEIGPEYYTMKVGDNPWAIAMKHHMKVQELLRLNGLNEERARKLKPGDRLRIR